MGWDLVIVACIVIAYAAVSGRLQGSPVTPAIVFVGFGLLLGSEGLEVVSTDVGSETVRLLAEATLALVLFSDAAVLDLKALRREVQLPARLLGIGLPLSIVLGALAAAPLLPGLGPFEAVVLAVILAPTDAALGQVVVTDRRLPSRLRQGLNVESGLNDGIAVPLLFAAIALAEIDQDASAGGILRELVKAIGVGTATGLVVAGVVAALMIASRRAGWLDAAWAQLAPVATVVAAFAGTTELGGSGFIAVFVAGMLYRRMLGAEEAHGTTKLTEELGGLLSAVTFFVFGASLVGLAVTDLDLATIAYAVLSLTAVRMIAVAVAFTGSEAAPPTIAFAGWFGPRGLASIVFLIVILEDTALPGTPVIVQAAAVAVLLSVLAHGLTAPWLTDRYARWLDVRRERLVMEREDHDAQMMERRSPWHRRAGGTPGAG